MRNIFIDIAMEVLSTTVSIFIFLIHNYHKYRDITTLVMSIQHHFIRDDLYNPKSHWKSGLYNLYSDRHPLSFDPRSKYPKSEIVSLYHIDL